MANVNKFIGLILTIVAGAVVGAILLGSIGTFESAIDSSLSLGLTSTAAIISLILIVPFVILLIWRNYD